MSLLCDKRTSKTIFMPDNVIVKYIAKLATRALIEEVSTTPKPGLVDKISNGAHCDMTYQTFIDSANAISVYFEQMAEVGYHWDKGLPELFEAIRIIGVEAEKAMFAATKNVNTHKGLIFSAGILSAASAYVFQRSREFDTEQIFTVCQQMTKESLERDFQQIDPKHPKTNGEKLYVRYGNRGIRGEVLDGFPSVQEYALPVMRNLCKGGWDYNKIKVQVLLNLMAQVEDTNVLSRTNQETLQYVKRVSRKVLLLGGAFTEEGRKNILELDKEFIYKNISSGGCADLLAVTIMIHSLEILNAMIKDREGSNVVFRALR